MYKRLRCTTTTVQSAVSEVEYAVISYEFLRSAHVNEQ